MNDTSNCTDSVRPARSGRWGPPIGFAAIVGSLLLISVAVAPSAAAAAADVDLGTAGTYSVLGGQTVTNTGPSRLSGDLGVSPGTAITGFPPGKATGATHAADATALQAQSDLTTAYAATAKQAPTQTVAGDLVGKTKVAGVYRSSGPLALGGTLTLDGQGDSGSVFIFQIASTLTTAAASYINMINGAQACHVFWQVGESATLGATSVFRGTIMALTSISVGTGAAVQGRALARNGAVTLNNNTFTQAGCGTSAPATATTTTESVPSDPVAAGSTALVTATVTAAGPTTPTGTVTIIVDGVPVGTASLDSTGHASFRLPAGLKPGPRRVGARHNGSLAYLPSRSAASTLTVRAAAPSPSASHTTTAAGSTTPTSATNFGNTVASTGPARPGPPERAHRARRRTARDRFRNHVVRPPPPTCPTPALTQRARHVLLGKPAVVGHRHPGGTR